MKVNNGDMPATPTVYQGSDDNELYFDFTVLTKREVFAKDAPDMPDWFRWQFKVDVSDVEAPSHSEEERRLCDEYNSDNFGLSRDDFDTGSRVASEVRQYHQLAEQEFNVKCFFAWRSYYADMMLKELDRGKS